VSLGLSTFRDDDDGHIFELIDATRRKWFPEVWQTT